MQENKVGQINKFGDHELRNLEIDFKVGRKPRARGRDATLISYQTQAPRPGTDLEVPLVHDSADIASTKGP